MAARQVLAIIFISFLQWHYLLSLHLLMSYNIVGIDFGNDIYILIQCHMGQHQTVAMRILYNGKV